MTKLWLCQQSLERRLLFCLQGRGGRVQEFGKQQRLPFADGHAYCKVCKNKTEQDARPRHYSPQERQDLSCVSNARNVVGVVLPGVRYAQQRAQNYGIQGPSQALDGPRPRGGTNSAGELAHKDLVCDQYVVEKGGDDDGQSHSWEIGGQASNTHQTKLASTEVVDIDACQCWSTP